GQDRYEHRRHRRRHYGKRQESRSRVLAHPGYSNLLSPPSHRSGRRTSKKPRVNNSLANIECFRGDAPGGMAATGEARSMAAMAKKPPAGFALATTDWQMWKKRHNIPIVCSQVSNKA